MAIGGNINSAPQIGYFLLRKAGADAITIKDFRRWESLDLVQRYTRSITFNDSLKFYKAPLPLMPALNIVSEFKQRNIVVALSF